MAQSYRRINFNINENLYLELEKHCGNNNAGRSALLNYLVASALAQKPIVEMLERRKAADDVIGILKDKDIEE